MKLTVAMKLYGGFAIILGLLLGVALIGATRLRQSAATAEQELFRHSMLPMQYALKTSLSERDASFNEKRALLKGNLFGDRADRIRQSRESMTQADNWAKKYAAKQLSTGQRQTWDFVQRAMQQVHADRARVLDLLQAGQEDEAGQLSASVTTQLDVLAFQMNQAVDQQTIDGEQASANILDGAQTAQQTMQQTMIVLALIATLLGGALAFWLARSIATGVNRMKIAAQGIAHGDLAQNVEVRSHDEIGEMADSFREIIAYLATAAETAEQIAAGDLTVRVEPKSDRDTLGNSFALMVRTLHATMTETRTAVITLAEAKDQFALQQVNSGAAQQATAIEESSAVSDRVAASAQQMATGAALAAERARATRRTRRRRARRASPRPSRASIASSARWTPPVTRSASWAHAPRRSATSWRRSTTSPRRRTSSR